MRRSLPILLVLALAFGTASTQAQGKFSGLMFGDYFYNVARDTAFRSGNLSNSAVSGQKDLQAFEFRRIYFTYDNDISEKFTTRFRLEADQALASSTGDVLSSGKISVYVKDAYLTWKNVFAGSNLTFGVQPTAAYDVSESAWGYRSLEKTIMDLRGIIPSRHLGISLKGKLDNEGMFNYWAVFSNNSTGTGVPNGTTASTDKFKRYSLQLQVKPAKNFQFTLYGDYLGAPEVNDPTSTSVPKATVSHATTTFAGFVGYKEPDAFNLGVEGFIQTTAHGMLNSSGTLKGLSKLGISVFGSANFSKDLALVARYDIFDPNTDGNMKGDARTYIIAGLDFKPDKNVSIIPNVQIETYQAIQNGRSIDASVTGRVTFYYVFL